MVDFYGLPDRGAGEWPGRAGARGVDGHSKASSVEAALASEIVAAMGLDFDRRRFVPFVVMHEFEGLLFSDCAAFSDGIGRPDLASTFRRIREEFKTPEDINDSAATAPSKRVKTLIPGYEKPLFGALAILNIGLDKIRAECPHFDDWLTRLESLAQ